jgi:tetratricopeptide (TPR) repeat protein
MQGMGMALKNAFRYSIPAMVAGVMLTVPAWAQDLTAAEKLYKHTEYEASLGALDKHAVDPASSFLAARDYYMLGDFKKSVEYLQKATSAQPNNSEYWDWLGRAYGRRAETSNPLSAPGYATKARAAFERSVELNDKNRDALSDLFDYYLEAPGFLGGGYDKATTVVEKTARIDPSEAYFQQAKLAQKRKEYESAEVHFRKAVESGPREIGHLLSLARFLAMQGRVRESDAVFQQAQQTAPNEPTVWFARADVLIQGKRNLDEARNLLQKYVSAPITVDDPPKTEALRLLKQVGGA